MDQAFWGSDQHRTWEESESDSDVSYDLEESEEESDSDSELDGEEEEEESEEEESEDEEDKRRKRPRFQAYKVPDTKHGAPKRKTIVRRKAKPSADTPVSVAESEVTRRETRDTTRARTLEVHSRSTPVTARKKASSPSGGQRKLTQEQLLEEARIVEEWNKADYDAYLRFTELSEKERNALMQKRRQRGPKNVYTIVTRSFIRNGASAEEIRIVPPVVEEQVAKKKDAKPPLPIKTVAEVLGLDQSIPEYADRSFKYRYPYGYMREFNTIAEFNIIHEEEQNVEREEAEKLLAHLHSLLV